MALRTVFIHAFREMRHGLKGFFLFLGCLTLGVAAIAASGTVNGAVQAGIRADAQTLLGGDMQVRLSWRAANAEEQKDFETLGSVAHLSYLRTMARGGRAGLIELKAVDGNYPLSGRLETTSDEPLSALLAGKDGVFGGIADRALLSRLDIPAGGLLKIGKISVRLRAEIRKEPDRTNAVSIYGPRLIISQEALAASGLVRPGSLYENRYNIRLENGMTFSGAEKFLKERHPEAEWKIRGLNDAASNMKRFFDDMRAYLTLVGLASLIVGGIGIMNAVRAWMNSRLRTIAVYRCVGASRAHLFGVSFVQIFILSCIGTLLGTVLGALIGDFGLTFLDGRVPFRLRSGVYAAPLVLAALYGLLISLIFSLPPLSALGRISPSLLMRRSVLPATADLSPGVLMGVFGGCGLLIALIIGTTPRQVIAFGFIAGVALSFLLFRGTAGLIRAGAKAAVRKYRIASPSVRLGLSNLYRPNAMTTAVMLSIGMGMTALVTIVSGEQNLSRQIADDLPEKAPSFYFTDIGRDQIGLFRRLVTETGNTLISEAPIARGRITALNGRPVNVDAVPRDVRWAVNSDRALTETGPMFRDTVVKEGRWWPENYAGTPLVSVESKIAEGLGLAAGDTLTANILGREITASVAGTRAVNWGTMQMNFAFIFSPGTFEGLPYMWIATVRSPNVAAEDALEEAVADAMPNAAPIRLREVADSASEIMKTTGKAVRWASLSGLLVGLMVLSGAMLAGQARRIREAVILKVLGATRMDIFKAYLVEFGLLGFLSALIACFLGSLASYAVITGVMGLNWTFMPATAAAVVVSCTAVTLCVGFLGTGQALGTRASGYLRRD
ncbi:MAG: ABC transporter permease [Alphaproteobacteria bacterium]|jgi:putative ABC transport system permease protein